MRSPSAADVVRVWELGREKQAWYRGLLMLAPALPGLRFHDLARLSLGQRNIALFHLHGLLFGDRLTALVGCPRCGKPSEFSAGIRELCPHEPPADLMPTSAEFDVETADHRVRCRLLTSEDLAGTGGDFRLSDPALLRRAVIAVRSDDTELAWETLPSQSHPAIVEGLYDHDPQLELLLSIDCADCGHDWMAPFDVVTFLWAEMTNLAQRLLNDVHHLARAYGWRESDVLAMSAARRQFYVEKATS